MNYENTTDLNAFSTENEMKNKILSIDKKQDSKLLNFSEKEELTSLSYLDFDLISDSEINNHSKSLQIQGKKYKTNSNNSNNNDFTYTKSYTNNDFDFQNKEGDEEDEENIRINILKESILIESIEKSHHGMWSSFSNKFSNLKNYIKYNLVPVNKKLIFSELPYITLFNNDFSKNQFSTPEFNLAFDKIFNFTYRTHFTELISKDGVSYNSDCGWGCMIRAAQMMLSKAILEFKIFIKGKEEKNLNQDEIFEMKLKVINLFFDNMINFQEKEYLDKTDFSYFFKNYTKLLNEMEKLNNNGNLNAIQNSDLFSEEIICEEDFQNKVSQNNLLIKGVFAPFSIQNITKVGLLYEAGPGVWFSDSKLIKIFKEIEEQLNIFDKELHIFSFDNGVIYEKNLIKECFEEVFFKCFFDCENSFKIENDDKNIDEIENYNFSCINYNKNNFNQICENCLEKLKKENNKTFNNEILEFEFHNNIEEKEVGDLKENMNHSKINDESEKSLKSKKKFYKLKKCGFLFISVRLGINSIEKEYHNSIKQFFKIPSNLGIIGGKSGSAYYFIGESQDKLIYLDPHFSQKAVENLTNLFYNGYESYEPKNLYCLDTKNMSPGFTMGFYFRNIEEYKFLKTALIVNSEAKYNLFSFEKYGVNEKSYRKDQTMINEEIKYKEKIEDDFSIIDLEDDF